VKIKKNVFDRNPPPADAFSEPPPVKQETTSRGRETVKIIIQQYNKKNDVCNETTQKPVQLSFYIV
jgi:hypothetical protein